MATLERVANLGSVKVVRSSVRALQVQSRGLGRLWIFRIGIHQTSGVQRKGDHGVLRLKAEYVKQRFDPKDYVWEDDL